MSDYAYHTAQALAKFYAAVEIGAERLPAGPCAGAVPVASWRRALADACAAAEPSDVLLNYTPASYAQWGWPAGLLAALRRFKAAHPGNRLFLLVHEVWNNSFKLKPHHLLRNQTAKRAYYRLGRLADGVAVMTEGQKQAMGALLGSERIRFNLVGANILPPSPDAGLVSNRQAGVWLTFGLAHTRLWTLQAFLPLLKSLHAQGRLQQLCAIGPAADKYARQEAALATQAFGPGVLQQLGALEPAEVSARLLGAEAALLGQDAAGLHKSGTFAAMAAHAVPVVCAVPARLVAPPGQALFRPEEVQGDPQVFAGPGARQRQRLLHHWFWSTRSWEIIGQDVQTWFQG